MHWHDLDSLWVLPHFTLVSSEHAQLDCGNWEMFCLLEGKEVNERLATASAQPLCHVKLKALVLNNYPESMDQTLHYKLVESLHHYCDILM